MIQPDPFQVDDKVIGWDFQPVFNGVTQFSTIGRINMVGQTKKFCVHSLNQIEHKHMSKVKSVDKKMRKSNKNTHAQRPLQKDIYRGEQISRDISLQLIDIVYIMS